MKKIAIITGAAGGIGQGYVSLFSICKMSASQCKTNATKTDNETLDA